MPLVVEVDGASHEGRARHDRARDRTLDELGGHVLRVPEQHVFADLDAVVACITQCALRLTAGR